MSKKLEAAWGDVLNVPSRGPGRKTAASPEDAIDALRTASDLIEEAVMEIKGAVRAFPAIRALANAYTIPHLQTWVKNDKYQTGTIPELLTIVKRGEEDEL